MKRFFSLLVAIAILSGISVALAENSVRFEGDGYASPEEAIFAYADAMSRCDFNDMLSVFALESYVENADPAKVFAAQRTINFHIGLCDTIVVNDEYTYALKLIKRVSAVTDRLYRQYLFLYPYQIYFLLTVPFALPIQLNIYSLFALPVNSSLEITPNKYFCNIKASLLSSTPSLL